MRDSFFICIVLFLLFSFASRTMAFNYLPKPVAGNQQLTYSQFTLSYSEEHEQPSWVAYELTAEEVKTRRDQCDCYAEDKTISTGSSKMSDYAYSGLVLAHLSPAEANTASEQANRESYLMSNISPQLPSLSNGIWADIEAIERKVAGGYGNVYVVSGPVFVNNLGKIGENGVTIPGYFFKAMLRFEGEKAITVAFMVPQVNAIGELKDYALSVNTVESITGLDFFPELDDSIENAVESSDYLGGWKNLVFH